MMSVEVELGNGVTPIANVSFINVSGVITEMTLPRNALRIWISCDPQVEGINALNDTMLSILVIPELRLQLRSVNVTNKITVDSGEAIALDCVAFSARSVGVFSWSIGGGHVSFGVGDVTMNKNKFYAGTYDFKRNFSFTARQSTIVSCNHQTEILHKESVFLRIVVNRHYSPRSDRSRDEQQFSQRNEHTRTVPDIALNVRSPPSIRLPERPRVQTSQRKDDDDENYHSLLAGFSETKITDRKNISLLASLSDGVFSQRWIGMVVKAKARKEYVIISMPKHTINQSRCNWDIFAKKLLELPDSNHIAKCEGLCVDGEILLVIQKYTHSEDLLRYLSENQTASDARAQTIQRLQISFQVLLGMEFLVSHGFAHPGLTIKKILITTHTVCQLYDFCNNDEAHWVVEALKKEKDFDCSKHSPEAIARNEHVFGSDVWYTSFTIWEILSTDSGQIRSEDIYCKTFSEVQTSYFPKPDSCPESIYKSLKDCWRAPAADRPTFFQIKECLKSELSLLTLDDVELSGRLSICKEDVTSDNSYESMEGSFMR